jgi:hypothetical protein
LPVLGAVAASSATLSFTLGSPAAVEAHVVDATGATVQQLTSGRRPAGPSTVAWDSSALPAARYRVVVTATVAGTSVTKWVDLTIDRTVTSFTVRDGDAGTTEISFALAQAATVTLEVDRGSTVVAQVVSGPLDAGPVTVSWDRTGFGKPLPAGDYTVVLTVTGALGAVPFTAPLTLP